MVGDRGMITSARVEALKEIPGMAWITCLRAPAIKKLTQDGTLQLSLFDTQDRPRSAHRTPRRTADRLPQPTWHKSAPLIASGCWRDRG